MANRAYGYQYETSPRKLEPDYDKTKVQKKVVKKQKKPKKKNKQKRKYKMSFEVMFFINSMMIFAAVFALIACQALVNQRYKEKERLKQEYNKLYSANSMASEKNDNIRFKALEYGMETKSAVLIDLETSDYIESSANKVEISEKNWFKKFINTIKNVIFGE